MTRHDGIFLRGNIWWTRVTDEAGVSVQRSTQTSDRAVARDMRRLLATLTQRRTWVLLNACARGGLTIGQIWDADRTNTLPSLIASLADVDLSPLVDEWKPRAEKQRTQIRTLIPKDERYPRSRLTKRAIRDWLDDLDVTGSTKNRYRSALSRFCRWLVEREILEHNPVRDVQQAQENRPRETWLPREQAKQLVGALPRPYRALEALMAGTGMEWQSVERLTATGVDAGERTIFADGGKKPWRRRTVRFTEDWAWPHFWEHARMFRGAARPFDGMTEWDVLLVHKQTSDALGLPRTTLHDWRHTYAVNAIRDGLSYQAVARQLGHRDTARIHDTYGKYAPDAEDYKPKRLATVPATTRKRKRA